jgi:hypothetical protein
LVGVFQHPVRSSQPHLMETEERLAEGIPLPRQPIRISQK